MTRLTHLWQVFQALSDMGLMWLCFALAMGWRDSPSTLTPLYLITLYLLARLPSPFDDPPHKEAQS